METTTKVEEHGIFNMSVSEPVPDVPVPLCDKLEAERREWTRKVCDMSARMKGIRDLVSLQVDVLSEQQRAVEKKSEYMSMQHKLKNKLDKMRGEKLEHFTVRYDRKLTNPEKDVLIASSLADLTEQMEHVSTQVDFFYETIRTINNIVYGLKLRHALEEYQRT